VRLQHFDPERRTLWFVTKNRKQQVIPLVDPELWDDLDSWAGNLQGESPWPRASAPAHADRPDNRPDYLLCRRRQVWRGYTADGGSRFEHKRYPGFPMGTHGLHDWWYARLQAAGLVPQGTTRGQRMHKARHSAGQRVLDATGNLKAAQKLLGHASIQTTADIYLDWDLDQLAETMRAVRAA